MHWATSITPDSLDFLMRMRAPAITEFAKILTEIADAIATFATEDHNS